MTASGEGARAAKHVGRALERFEDAALLAGRGRFADDLPVRADCLHAAILRSPHAHAEIVSIDARPALAMAGVAGVVTGAEAKALTAPFTAGVKAPLDHYCLAVDRVRYVGEPVAIVAAADRYLAEDALERIAVEYRPLPCVVEPEAAARAEAPVLHPRAGSNLISRREFTYGDPDAAFARAPHRIGLTLRYPRNSGMPLECFVVVAEHDPGEDAYDVLANFQGPFSLHAVMARALKVPANRLRLRTPPESGGSFGVKQAVFPYIVAIALAARVLARPVKWAEDRLEHLVAASAASGRVTRIEAAVAEDGEITALEIDQMDDCGAYLRAPEPASLYRMHGNLSGAYKLRHIRAVNRVVLTNTVPSGLNRGFGGPQLYFAIERLRHEIGRVLDLDPLEVILRNLVPSGAFPYRCPAGAVLDSGDYPGAVRRAVEAGGLTALRERRERARTAGRLYGIGFAAVVEPSVSNMGYITTVLTAGERRRAGPKDGALSSAHVSVDPLGSVSVGIDSVPQGQGHRTVTAQVVADVLGLEPAEVRVDCGIDTGKDAWSIAAGNYSSRFAPAVAGAAHLAATRLRDKLARVASQQLNVPADEVRFAQGKVYAADNPDNARSFRRVAAAGHWSPGSLPEADAPALRETAAWSPPGLDPPDEADRINAAAAYGFIFDFCGVEIDRETGRVGIDKYVTLHDAGRLLNPALAKGQIRGGFAHGVGAALFERFVYDRDGQFLSGSFADYLAPTACEIPEPVIFHVETPSPVTPLGAKGLGEGNAMSTPVCLANAVADALDLDEVTLPLTPSRVAALIAGAEPPRPAKGGAR